MYYVYSKYIQMQSAITEMIGDKYTYTYTHLLQLLLWICNMTPFSQITHPLVREAAGSYG